MDDVRLQLQALLPEAIRHRPWVKDVAVRLHDLPARRTVSRADGSPQYLYFVAKGWLRGSTALSATVRPIGTLRIRGDIIGLPWLDRPNRLEDVGTITQCELISVSAHSFREHMRQDSVLQDFVRDEIVRDMMNLRMMTAVIGHLKAPDRLAYFLFIMLNRCRRTYRTPLKTLTVPMTQEEIGRILGLTNVSVNRAFRSLESDGLIETERQSVRFLDESAFARRFDMGERSELIAQLVGNSLVGSRAA